MRQQPFFLKYSTWTLGYPIISNGKFYWAPAAHSSLFPFAFIFIFRKYEDLLFKPAMAIKQTVACNQAVNYANQAISSSGAKGLTPPSMWYIMRRPYNPVMFAFN